MTPKILIDALIFGNELNVLIVVDSFMRSKISFAVSLMKPIPLFNSCYYEGKQKIKCLVLRVNLASNEDCVNEYQIVIPVHPFE